MLRSFAAALVLVTPSLAAQSRPVTLRSGPMVGASEMREVKLWAQTTGPARVKIFYWDSTAPRVRFATNEVLTRRDSAYVAHLVADQVEPGRVNGYDGAEGGRIGR